MQWLSRKYSLPAIMNDRWWAVQHLRNASGVCMSVLGLHWKLSDRGTLWHFMIFGHFCFLEVSIEETVYNTQCSCKILIIVAHK